jgi:hypothetical protein
MKCLVERLLEEYERIDELVGKVGGRYFGFVFRGLRRGGKDGGLTAFWL